MKKFLPFLAIAAAFTFYQVQKLRNSLSLSIKKVKPDLTATLQTGGKIGIVNISLEVLNPSNISLTVTGIYLNVLSHNVLIGKVIRPGSVTIPKGTTTLEMVLQIPISNLPAAAGELVKDLLAGDPVEINFQGIVKLGIIGSLTINEPYKVL